jgi:hypothetical protein
MPGHLNSFDEVCAALPVERLKVAFDTLGVIVFEYYEPRGDDWCALVEARRQLVITARELHGEAAIKQIDP